MKSRGKKVFKVTALIVSVILLAWTVLTVWVELKGPEKSMDIGSNSSGLKVLIVYDPDPLYNLDEQVCTSFGQALSEEGIQVQIKTVSAAEKISGFDYNLYVFCANTYNWRPDWAISSFIKHAPVNNKSIVAITLGSGSTASSKKELERIIEEKNGNLISSRSFWMMRPNDELRLNEPNVDVCLSLVHNWALEIAREIKINSNKYSKLISDPK